MAEDLEKQVEKNTITHPDEGNIENAPLSKKAGPHPSPDFPHPVPEDSKESTQEQEVAPNAIERIPTSDRPYSSFTQPLKYLIVLCATVGGFFSRFSINVYFPAINTIVSSLHTSITDVNLTITMYMIFQGIAPSFLSAITEQYGRRPAYVVGFVFFITASIGLALNGTFAGLLVLRGLQSCGSSAMFTLMEAVIADVVISAEKWCYIGITSGVSILAPSVAPIVGGALSQHLAGIRSFGA